jgi:hypothetical protein
MYSIERKSSGYLLTFGGVIGKEEMAAWVSESEEALKDAPSTFGVIVDMRNLAPLQAEVQQVMVQGQGLYKNAGMQRSALVLNSSAVTIQFKRLSKESGIYAFERYIDASSTPNWTEVAVKWVRDEIDPDA